MTGIRWAATGASTLLLLVPAAVAHADDLYQFQSPSGNIACVMAALSGTTPEVACEIVERTWNPPAKPATCDGDWGDRITLQQGATPALTCHTDTTRGLGLPALAYGTAHTLAGLTCASDEAGITCTDSTTGHYFSLSRDAYELH